MNYPYTYTEGQNIEINFNIYTYLYNKQIIYNFDIIKYEKVNGTQYVSRHELCVPDWDTSYVSFDEFSYNFLDYLKKFVKNIIFT